MKSKLVLAAGFFLLGGCYHAIVQTGLAPSTTVIKKPWAHSFIAGLIPPAPVDAKTQCPRGVARVETVHSFPNLLAGFVTGSIYSPITITVTCAQ